jgi:hypothetical protein
MRKLLVFALMLTFVGSAVAFDLGNEKTAKPVVNYPQNVPNPDRQGGDTILDAVMVTLPVVDGAGTTAGYNDDYDEVCPYTNSTAPDVVYTFTNDMDAVIDVDLCGSSYDTKVYVYDEGLNLVACNDDFYFDDACGVYVSKIEGLAIMGGVQYFVIVDGYGSDFGDYVINIVEFEPCVVECPAGATLEGEPPLANDYVDLWNGGCNTDPVTGPFQPITDMIFCGVSGFYLSGGSNFRDTDWFLLEIPEGGVLEIVGDAELATYMFELGPQDCGAVGVIQNIPIGPCSEGTMTITGNPGDIVWFWVGPQTFASPDGSDVYEYDYVLVTNLVTATENHTLTGVKALFN